MKKRIKKYKKFQNLLFYLLVPVLLVSFWLFASLFFVKQTSFSVIDYAHSAKDIREFPSGKILKGKKIKGTFIARENNLGIVKIRFSDFIQQNYNAEDILAFRIKEEGDTSWRYFNNYRSGLLQGGLLLPFGFPKIADSQGKKYYFEVESLLGNGENSVQFHPGNNVLFTSYQYNKEDILKSKKSIISYFIKKFISSYTNLDFILSSTLFILPLFYFIVFVVFLKFKKKLGNANNVSFIVLSGVAIDILSFRIEYLGIVLCLLGVWIAGILYYKISARTTLLISFTLIIIWISCSYFKVPLYYNKFNIWVYAFLLVGSVQLLFEEKLKLLRKK